MLNRLRLSRVLPALAAALGALQALGARHLMNPDGVSYLDIADAYLRGDWHAALNTYWNPLYTWILAAGLWVFRPSPDWEFPVVHVLNVLIYLCAIACFQFFLRNLIRWDRQRRAADAEGSATAMAEPVWWAVGYSVFTVFSLGWIGLEVVSPDMTVAALIFLAGGLLLRTLAAGESRWSAFALGLCLGAAYLAKVATAMPVIAVFGLAGAALHRRGALLRSSLIAVGLLLTAGPYVSLLSAREGRFTVSDAGTLNYAWYVNAVPSHWLGERPGFGVPVNPHQKILDFPAAYAFDPAAPGTYPGWFDPARWYEGVTPRLQIARQLYAIKRNAELLFTWLFTDAHASLVVGMLALVLLAGRTRALPRDAASRWFLIAPGGLAVLMYSLVWVEMRFFGAVLAMFWLGVFSALRAPADAGGRGAVRYVAIATMAVILMSVAGTTVIRAYEVGREPPKDWQLAAFLRNNGIGPGDRVAVIGHVNRCGWARLAGVRITAEIPAESEADFAAADPFVQSRAVQALFATGVRAVVADQRVGTGCRTGWRPAGVAGFHLCEAPSRLSETVSSTGQ